MHKFGFVLLAGFLAVCLSGCIVVTDSPGGVRKQWSTDETVIAEIDAASELMFDDAKTRTLTDIAARPNLSARAQVRLVRTAMDTLMFDNAKQKVMLVLIDNPYFVREGKKAVLEHIDEFMFDSARQSILKAISRRGTLPSEEELRQRTNNPLPPASPVETELTVEVSASYGKGL